MSAGVKKGELVLGEYKVITELKEDAVSGPKPLSAMMDIWQFSKSC